MKEIFKHPRFLGSALCHSLTYGLMYAYITLFPFLLIEIFHEKNPALVGIYSAYMIAFYLLGAFFASRLVLRWTTQKMAGIGIALQILSGVLLMAVPPFLFIPALFLFNVSLGIILPTTSAIALAPFAGKAVGAASSSLGLSYRLIGSIISTLICQLPLAGGRSLAAAILLLSGVSLAIYLTKVQNATEVPANASF